MKNIVPKISSSFSKMWNKILNLENSLFPELQESLRIEEFSTKEAKLIRVLYFAEIEKLITITSQTNTPKYREQIARAFVAKSVYNFQTTRDLINRLHFFIKSNLYRIKKKALCIFLLLLIHIKLM